MTPRNTNHSGLGVSRQPSAIHFGPNQRFALAGIVGSIGRRALLCTDARMASSDDFRGILASLEEAAIEVTVYSEIQPDLPSSNVEELVRHVGDKPIDVIVGIGGGSCLDMAKIASVLLTHGGKVSDYYGEFKVPGPITPVITVPTTGGTGAEVTCISVIYDADLRMKVGVASPFLEPHTAIVDPVLTLSCPPGLTAATGADALSHLIEAFTAISKNPEPSAVNAHVYVGKNLLTDTYCRVGLDLLNRFLERAYTAPDDLEARSNTMLAALNAGLSINTAGTAGAHAVQSPIGALTHTAHGMGVGALLPYVMRFNLPARVSEFAEVGRIFGVATPEQDEELQAHSAIERVEQILATLGVPSDLEKLGLKEADISTVAEQSLLATRLTANNPRELTTESVGYLLRKAHAGDRTWWS